MLPGDLHRQRAAQRNRAHRIFPLFEQNHLAEKGAGAQELEHRLLPGGRGLVDLDRSLNEKEKGVSFVPFQEEDLVFGIFFHATALRHERKRMLVERRKRLSENISQFHGLSFPDKNVGHIFVHI